MPGERIAGSRSVLKKSLHPVIKDALAVQINAVFGIEFFIISLFVESQINQRARLEAARAFGAQTCPGGGVGVPAFMRVKESPKF